MSSNREISRLFNLYAELLLLHNKNEGLAKGLAGASYRIRNLNEDLLELNKKQLAAHLRPELARIVEEIKDTGNVAEIDELIQLTPAGLFEMMRIRGLGGKKLAIIWRLAKIDSLESLLQACKRNEISKLPGFGAKTEQNIVEAIEADRSSRDRFHYATVAEHAALLVESLRTVVKTKLISLSGEVRRQATTIAGIEIVAAVEASAFKAEQVKRWMVVQSSDDATTKGHTLEEIPVTIHHTTGAKFYHELFIQTGSEAHVKKLIGKLDENKEYKSEEAIYKEAGLPYILPELREDVAEWKYNGDEGSLIEPGDIKGVVHNHTDWSDGVDSLEDFVQACKKKKFEYVVISDHSKNAHYAGGLKEDKLLLQWEAIDDLNKQLKPFRIFKSIECDILVSGDLDYEADILKRFDLVIISVHQLLKMDEGKATSRLIKAIENPYSNLLGHMTGRQLLIRPGYPVDFKKVIDACAANGVVIEINANPYRLDMDWSHIPYALEKGVMISINPDAHSIGEIDNIRWGVSAARKGGLTKDMTWNAMPLKKIEQWLSSASNARF